jgi:hypothetical protein
MAAAAIASTATTAITIPPDAAAVTKPARRRPKNQGLHLHHMAGGLMFALGITWCISTEYLVLRQPEVRGISNESISSIVWQATAV